jgi:hypothetical protein
VILFLNFSLRVPKVRAACTNLVRHGVCVGVVVVRWWIAVCAGIPTLCFASHLWSSLTKVHEAVYLRNLEDLKIDAGWFVSSTHGGCFIRQTVLDKH